MECLGICCDVCASEFFDFNIVSSVTSGQVKIDRDVNNEVGTRQI